MKHFRNNALLIVSALIYLLVVAGLSVLIDTQFYRGAKRVIMRDEYPDYPPRISTAFKTEVSRIFNDLEARDLLAEEKVSPEHRSEIEALVLADEDRDRIRASINEQIADLLRTDVPIITVSLLYRQREIVHAEREEATDFNTIRNSLILQNYRIDAGISFDSEAYPNQVAGVMAFRYTTPNAFAPIEALTRKYWLYTLANWFLVSLAYFLILRFTVLPIRKVSEAIDAAEPGARRFIARPHTRLEHLYNRMARDAMLTDLNSRLTNSGQRSLRLSLADLFSYLQPRVTQWFGFDRFFLMEMSWQGKDLLRLESTLPEEDGDGESARELAAEVFDEGTARNLRTALESGSMRMQTRRINDRGYAFLSLLPGQETPERLRVLVLYKQGHLGSEAWAWQETTAERLHQQIIRLVEHQNVQSRELFREKSEANISLSRNLGHDLTNIIATNKLELMTIGQILRGDAGDWAQSPQKIQVVERAMRRVLDNTRSLQEIVNLYRAYEYLRSPRYEEADLNRLVGEVIDIFRLSMSSAAEIAFESDGDLPTCPLEPRLLKLAFFNILSNALDAIRRLSPEDQTEARISVQTLWDRDKKRILVRFFDTGPGIRTPEGRRATREEINRVFDLGYTTKDGGQGEGLGLNWVKTILTEFHPGELCARNRSEGGAVFEFVLPVGEPVKPTE
ncbi:HAMP domain-containing histidine kinase [bacterium]|nr:HAMP domain-containing histidine kinase [bacterium]